MPDSSSDALAVRRRRLLFRATHRGTHENDLMIGGFVRAHLESFGADELDALETLLEWPETSLADWLTGWRPLPDDAPPMLRRMRAAVAEKAEASKTPPPLVSLVDKADQERGEGAVAQYRNGSPPPPILGPLRGPSPRGEGESGLP